MEINKDTIEMILLFLYKIEEYEACEKNASGISEALRDCRRTSSQASKKLTSAFKVRIGGVNEYRLEIPASKFKISTLLKKTIYTYLSADAKIILTESGEFEVILNKSALLGVSLEKAGYLRIDVDAIYSDALTKLKCEKNICVQSRK